MVCVKINFQMPEYFPAIRLEKLFPVIQTFATENASDELNNSGE
jgi:hypothetical protein